MFITLMKSKIHRAVITESNINYIGSITIDKELMDAAGLLENEKVHVLNINNGNRFETYVIPDYNKSRVVCINGAAARLVQPGDIVIIISYGLFDTKEASEFKPDVVFVNEKNEIIRSC